MHLGLKYDTTSYLFITNKSIILLNPLQFQVSALQQNNFFKFRENAKKSKYKLKRTTPRVFEIDIDNVKCQYKKPDSTL